ncbi:MAG: histidine kinase dimerization/phospho-acceptor domain-containing protein [Dehalococcoidia bacterium]
MSDGSSDDREYFRQEALGAFAHEIRTPLTSLRMVVELARREGENDMLVLDEELASMLHQSISDLQQLADDLQEQSRLERGRAPLGSGPCELAAAVEAAREMLRPAVNLHGDARPAVEGPWDATRLVKAIAGFAESANRIGDGSGDVRLESDTGPDGVRLRFSSGSPGGSPRPMAADAGFAFFRARQYVLAVGGRVECHRGDRSVVISVTLPRNELPAQDTEQ